MTPIGGPVVAPVLRARIDALCPDTNCIDPATASEQPSEPDGSEPAAGESEGV